MLLCALFMLMIIVEIDENNEASPCDSLMIRR
jgi:hypothetical protein